MNGKVRKEYTTRSPIIKDLDLEWATKGSFPGKEMFKLNDGGWLGGTLGKRIKDSYCGGSRMCQR